MGEFRVSRASIIYKASIRYIDLLYGSCNGNYPPENVLDIKVTADDAQRLTLIIKALTLSPEPITRTTLHWVPVGAILKNDHS